MILTDKKDVACIIRELLLLPYSIKLIVFISNWHFNMTFETVRVGEEFGCLFCLFQRCQRF